MTGRQHQNAHYVGVARRPLAPLRVRRLHPYRMRRWVAVCRYCDWVTIRDDQSAAIDAALEHCEADQ